MFLFRAITPIYFNLIENIIYQNFFIFGYSLTIFNLSDRRDIYLHLAEHQKVSDFFIKVQIDAMDNLSCREFAPPLSTYAKMTGMFTLVKLRKL